MKHIHWFWCWLCYRAYLALPMPDTHKSLYGRFSLWILGFAGFYAYDPCHEARAMRRSPQDTVTPNGN